VELASIATIVSGVAIDPSLAADAGAFAAVAAATAVTATGATAGDNDTRTPLSLLLPLLLLLSPPPLMMARVIRYGCCLLPQVLAALPLTLAVIQIGTVGFNRCHDGTCSLPGIHLTLVYCVQMGKLVKKLSKDKNATIKQLAANVRIHPRAVPRIWKNTWASFHHTIHRSLSSTLVFHYLPFAIHHRYSEDSYHIAALIGCRLSW